MERPKAYSYIRMSTPDQLKGDSLRRQLEKTRQYAATHDLDLVEQFDDLGVSAYRGRNVEFGALSRFLELIDSGDIARGSYLIVESMDRLSRDKVMKAFGLLNQIIGKGITVVTLDDQQEYSSESFDQQYTGIIIALAAMARAHSESKRKSGLLSDAWTQKKRVARESGKVLTKRMPAWLELDEKVGQIVVREERAKVVNEIFTKIRDGWGAFSLSRHLNERGEKAWGGRKNAVWRESYIKKIILSRTVLGEYHPHKMIHDSIKGSRREPDGPPIIDYYPAVVSPQLFQDAHLAMVRRRTTGRGRKGKGYSNLFTGLLRCTCGSGYRYNDKGPPPKGGQYLQCSVAFAKGGCGARPFRYQILESTLLEVITSIDVARVLGGQSRSKRLTSRRLDLAMYQADREAIEKKIERVIETITSDDSAPARVLKVKLAELESQRDGMAQTIYDCEQEISELLELDPEKHQKAISRLIGEIRSETGSPQNESARRALVGELQRVIEFVRVAPRAHQAWELMDEDPNWKATYAVSSQRELERMAKDHGFELRIQYRNGDLQPIDGLTGRNLMLKGSRKQNELRVMAEADSRLSRNS